MTVKELSERLDLTALTRHGWDGAVGCCYSGDLLSWVMAHAQRGCVWVTIMGNLAVAAVAELVGASCVIIAEGAEPDAELLESAERRGLCLLSSPKTASELCFRIMRELDYA